MGDLVDIVLEADRWGTRRLLEASAALPALEFVRPMEIGLGSLHDTFEHLVRAARFFAALLEGRSPEPPVRDGHATPQAMLESYDSASDALRNAIERTRGQPDDAPVELPAGPRGEPATTVRRVELLGQVLTHGAYHRAQIANMLRRLGVSPVPHTDLIHWAIEGAGRRAAR